LNASIIGGCRLISARRSHVSDSLTPYRMK
jgi:hypothetical protein